MSNQEKSPSKLETLRLFFRINEDENECKGLTFGEIRFLFEDFRNQTLAEVLKIIDDKCYCAILASNQKKINILCPFCNLNKEIKNLQSVPTTSITSTRDTQNLKGCGEKDRFLFFNCGDYIKGVGLILCEKCQGKVKE